MAKIAVTAAKKVAGMSSPRPAGLISKENRVFNFGAGPAMLPEEVMRQAQEEFLDWHGCGMSVLEMSHRSEEFLAIAADCEAGLRALLTIPDNYHILFLQGGATSQFSMVPLNLLAETDTADYVNTGYWSTKAIKEAARFANVHVAASSETKNFMTIPERQSWKLSDDPVYLYFTWNETIGGVEFPAVPEAGDIPLVSDVTSNFLTRDFDVSRFGLVFAGAQKNFGPSGLLVVLIREDLAGQPRREGVPSLYQYGNHAKTNSMLNTPPTFSWYIAGLMFKWIREQGGVDEMERRSIGRSQKLYTVIDNSGFYNNPVDVNFRSRMNVPFTLADDKLDSLFLKEAGENGLVALKGHRSVGGMRASMYNGMPEAGVDALISFMLEFERRYG